MKESDINTIVSNSLKSKGVAHKIADHQRGQGTQSPFDGFAALPGVPIYWESKLLKGYQAFSFKKIEPHQIENLITYKKLIPLSECVIVLAVWESRHFLDFYFFDIRTILTKMENSLSYKKVELLEMKDKNLSTTLLPKQRIFDPIEALIKKV